MSKLNASQKSIAVKQLIELVEKNIKANDKKATVKHSKPLLTLNDLP